MRKLVLLLMACSFTCAGVFAQSLRIKNVFRSQDVSADSDTIWPKQITGTDMYFEYLIQGKDTILRFTGKGHLSSRKAGEWYKYKATITCVEVCEGIKTVDGLASCPKLKKVTLPNGLKKINKEAFRYDSNLRQINFPEGLDSIFGYAFYQAGSPEDSLRFPASLSYIAGNCFLYNKFTYVEVPMKIDSFLSGASFGECHFLSTVILPANLGYMPMNTFSGDTSLRQIYNLNVHPIIINEKIQRAFYRLNRSKCRLIVPTASVELYKSTPVWKDFMIEAGGISVGVCFNDKYKGNVYGLENRFYKKGEKVTLRAEPYNGCTFSGWKCNGQLLSTANPLSFTVTKDTMIQACFDGEVAVREPLKPVSASVTIYPNPTGDMFSVRSESQVEEIVVSDLSGRVLLRTERTSHADVSALPQGLYLVRVRTEKGSCVKKLVRR